MSDTTVGASASVTAPTPAVPTAIEPAIAATTSDANALAKKLLDGARDLLTTVVTAGEADAEALVPTYETAAVNLASGFLPTEFRGIVSTVAQFAGQPISALNAQLDAMGKAFTAIAVARLDSTVAHLGG